MNMVGSSIRVAAFTMLICVVGYTAVILALAQAFAPGTARGSLLTAPDGRVIGSRLVAQGFTRPSYFWSRPSAVDYNGAGAGGSNKSPTSEDLTERARHLVARFGASPQKRLPAELAAASGSGLDPHITVPAARYQAARVAAARDMPRERVERVIERLAFSPGGPLTSSRLVNVLELNLAMDALGEEPRTSAD